MIDTNPDALVAVQVTCGSEDEADAMASLLVERRLAACCWITPMRSVYRWDGALCRDDELLVSAKTTAGSVDGIVAAITEIHSYDLPAIITMPLGASDDYVAWVHGEVG